MIRAKNLLLIWSVFILSVLACTRATVPDPTKASDQPRGEITRNLTYAGLDRSYIIHIPSSMDWSQPMPLVFVFHGGAGNAASIMRISGFNKVADQNGFGVVYPNGTGGLSEEKLLVWNGGTCCGYALMNNVDDVGFVRSIVTDLQSLLNIDTKRIYATGLSNGAFLSHRLACEAADLFAAVAPVAGTLNIQTCTPSQPISVIEFHGTDDQHVLYDGGNGPASVVDVDFVSVRDTIEFWASSNECESQPQTNSFDDIQHEIWTGCASSVSVELYTIIDGGHSWPGGQSWWVGDQPTTTISASQLIWEFFEAHAKP